MPDYKKLRQELDHSVAQLQDQILSKKQAFNEGIPALMLPAETICNILRMTLQQQCDEKSELTSRTRLNLSQVCHRWRELALSDPVLWAFMDDSLRFDSLPTMLKRAQNMPLSFSFNRTKLKSLISFLTEPVLKQCRDLSFHGPRKLIDYVVSDLLFSTRSLETLELRCQRREGSSLLPFIQSYLSYPLPNLRSLVLRHVAAPWTRPFLGQNMTRLEIYSVVRPNGHLLHDDRVPSQTYADMLHALERMPNLTHLALIGVFPHLLKALPHAPHHIPLLRLAQFTFHAPGPVAPDLLSRISIPVSCHIRAWFSGRFASNSAATIASFLRKMHPFDPKQALMASLQEDHNQATLSFMLDDLTLEPFPISVTFFDRHPVGDMLALWNALPLITLRTLDIIQDNETCGETPTTPNTAFVHSWFPAEWHLLLGPCSNLQMLLLQSDDSDLFLHFAQSAPLAPLPSISNLVVNIAFRFSDFQSLVFEHFREYFQTRDLNHLRLPQLHIYIPERRNPPIFPADDVLSTRASVSVAMDPDW